jgi:hypothetical protein
LSAAVLVAVHQRIAAVAALVGAIVAGLIAMVQKFGGGESRGGVPQPLGRGPYVTCDCAPDASFTARLAEMDQQLRDAAASAHWTIDWDTFCKHENAAAAAARAGNHLEAVRGYCRAISCMMEQLRHQTDFSRGARC